MKVGGDTLSSADSLRLATGAIKKRLGVDHSFCAPLPERLLGFQSQPYRVGVRSPGPPVTQRHTVDRHHLEADLRSSITWLMTGGSQVADRGSSRGSIRWQRGHIMLEQACDTRSCERTEHLVFTLGSKHIKTLDIRIGCRRRYLLTSF